LHILTANQNHFFDLTAEAPFITHSGGELKHAQLAYQTWGTLNADKSNAILLSHALSGSQNVVGYTPEIEGVNHLWTEDNHYGWWDEFMGPGKAIDTDKYFVICANYLGGCYGSTGPHSINPETSQPYGKNFPSLHVADQAKAFMRLVDSFGIQKLHAAIGPSVGGLITLTIGTTYADRVQRVIPMCAGYRTTVLTKLLLFEQILAIENDPNFNAGDYYGENQPVPTYGLALARMISHKTFVHLDLFESRAKREIRPHKDALAWYEMSDPFQSYMLHQGKKFVNRFDANTYLRIIDMWSKYDAEAEASVSSPEALFSAAKANNQSYLVFSIDSDFCFYPEEQAELVRHLEDQDINVMHITVHSSKGHDSFLLEPKLFTPHLREILDH